MKTHIYILFFILLFNKINAQTGYDSLKSKVYKLNNFITSIEFGPQYCYRSMSGSSQYRYVAIKWDAADAGFPKPAIYYDKKMINLELVGLLVYMVILKFIKALE